MKAYGKAAAEPRRSDALAADQAIVSPSVALKR